MDTIGKRFKKWRLSQNFSIEQFSKIIDIPKKELCAIENGLSLPSYNALNKLRIFTEIDFKWLYFGDDYSNLPCMPSSESEAK